MQRFIVRLYCICKCYFIVVIVIGKGGFVALLIRLKGENPML